jgi:glycosyltransferase involved in cell wall biosynthesis
MNRISACVITLNEEHTLARTLASLQGVADEIVVVDSGSTDRTEEIAREHGAKFCARGWTNYSEQRNFAAAQASHDWTLCIDADEELDSPLQRALLEWKKQTPDADVYEMARRTWYLGAWIKHSGWYPNFQRRLYRRDKAKFVGIVHEKVEFEGTPGRLKGDLLHYTVRSFAEHEANVERYATLGARHLFEQGNRSWRGAVWFATPWSWFQNYFLRGGFLDGYRGAVIAQMAARSVRLKYTKLGQLIRDERSKGGAAS